MSNTCSRCNKVYKFSNGLIKHQNKQPPCKIVEANLPSTSSITKEDILKLNIQIEIAEYDLKLQKEINQVYKKIYETREKSRKDIIRVHEKICNIYEHIREDITEIHKLIHSNSVESYNDISAVREEICSEVFKVMQNDISALQSELKNISLYDDNLVDKYI
jgi:hypothetical protein